MESFFAATSPESEAIVDKLRRIYLSNLALGHYKALETAVTSIVGFSVAAGVIRKNVLYVSVRGGARARILRNGESATILQGENGKVTSGSGFLKNGDTIFLETKSSSVKFQKKGFWSGILTALPKRKIYIKIPSQEAISPQSKKTTLFVGIILLLMLGVSTGFGIRQKNIREKQVEASKKELEAQAREAAGYFNSEPELFLDLTLLSAGFKGDSLSVSAENLFVLDKTNKKIVGIEIPSKKSKVIAGTGKLGETFDITSYEDRVFILALDGVKEVKEEMKGVIEKDWGENALIHAFAGNLYVLDKEANAVYRFAGNDSSFGSKQNWLSASTKSDFSNVKSWTFDGSIYILTSSGKVLKFSGGSPQNFTLPTEASSVDAIFASDENEFLYILDKLNGKVVVTGKNGEFKAQYSSDKISEAVGLVASEAEKKIILLTGEKLLSIEMKHL